MSDEDEKKQLSQKSYISSECSSGHAERSFYNPVEEIQSKGHTFLLQSPTMMGKVYVFVKKDSPQKTPLHS